MSKEKKQRVEARQERLARQQAIAKLQLRKIEIDAQLKELRGKK